MWEIVDENVKNGVLVLDELGSIMCVVTEGSDTTRMFTHNLDTERRMYSHMCGHSAFSPIENNKVIMEKETVFVAGQNSFDDLIYILTEKENVYSYSLEENKLIYVSKVDERNLSKIICFNPENGDIYGVIRDGNFWKLSNKKINYLNEQILCMKNRNHLACACKLVWFKDKIFDRAFQDAYRISIRI